MMKLVLAPKSIERIEEEKSSNRKVKKSGQNTSENHENEKTLQLKIRDNFTLKHGYIDSNQEFTRSGNHPSILPLFGRLGEISHFTTTNLKIHDISWVTI
jgi:hypothetical protein